MLPHHAARSPLHAMILRTTAATGGPALLTPPGKNGLLSEAGMLTRMNAALREIATSTAIVASYGSIDRNWLGSCMPSPWRWN